MSYQRQMCRARTRVLVNAGRYPIFVLGPLTYYQPTDHHMIHANFVKNDFCPTGECECLECCFVRRGSAVDMDWLCAHQRATDVVRISAQLT